LLWVGNSRSIACVTVLHQLSHDHSHVQTLVDRDELSPDETEEHPMAHVITWTLGAEELLEVDAQICELEHGDHFLLCTDGLTREVPEGDIVEFLARIGLDAAPQAFDDIQCHEMALVAGLRAALHAMLKHMEPAELENRLHDHSLIDNLMPTARKAKYWDLFTETYQAVAADDFMHLFRDAFTRAYEDAAHLRQVRPHDKTSP